MPVIKIDMGLTSKEVKKELIEKVTKAMSETTNIPEQHFTVIISEGDADNFGVGGVQLSEMHK
ncbi:2-hydroxymuconate tautomerase family protein [Vallitalea pronyensis]|uniref:Tautomerase n=1 Tax=Vallitalea pronyensis TaxID=1348613 RepID=A0A8J8SJR6_9FIRM|nr:4-oxalocrotonate tautomerase DmpI [Vallitalea pronyensis]QUI25858.1 2-hydroxymuconate tautomerase family protein [Vallitalea pronyensis]